MTVEHRMQALLDLVEADRREQTEAIAREAQAVVAALLEQAHREARARMRQAFVDERRLRDQRVQAADANLQTRRRLAAQQRATALLAEAWVRLPDAFLARWRAPETRREWITRIVARGRASLSGGVWCIAHAPDWAAAEREERSHDLAREAGTAPEFRVDAGIRAGLRIAAAGTVVDGTLDGLLRDRAENGARLLAILGADEPGQ
jgi:hypothetical protein